MGPERYRTMPACRAAGASFRQADYWERTGVLVPTVPARGSGSQREYSADEVRLLAACARLAALGARTGVLTRMVGQLRALGSSLWPAHVTVDADGNVSLARRLDGAAYALDLAACAAVVPSAIDTTAVA